MVPKKHITAKSYFGKDLVTLIVSNRGSIHRAYGNETVSIIRVIGNPNLGIHEIVFAKFVRTINHPLITVYSSPIS